MPSPLRIIIGNDPLSESRVECARFPATNSFTRLVFDMLSRLAGQAAEAEFLNIESKYGLDDDAKWAPLAERFVREAAGGWTQHSIYEAQMKACRVFLRVNEKHVIALRAACRDFDAVDVAKILNTLPPVDYCSGMIPRLSRSQ